MCRLHHSSRPVIPPAPLDHPVVAKILQGTQAIIRNRRRTLKSYRDKEKGPEGAATRRSTPRPRAPTRVVAGRKKAHILSVPLELVIEIGRHSHPSDLLALSRTCTQLNSMLASKSTQFLWKDLLNTVAFSPHSRLGDRPPIPPYMNELQYTDFVWGTQCMACSSPRNCGTFWSLQVRLCRRCQPINLVGTEELLEHAAKSTKASQYIMRRIVFASPVSDDYFRSPSYLGTAIPSFKGLLLRDEAMFILEALIEAKKGRKKKNEFESYIIAIAADAFRRVQVARQTAAAFSPRSVKYMGRTKCTARRWR